MRHLFQSLKNTTFDNTSYIWGPEVDQQLADERVASLTEEGRVLWALSDHLGTVRDVAEYSDYGSINGTVVWKHRRYDVFGNVQHFLNRGDLNGDEIIDEEDLELLFYAIDNNVFETFDDNGDVTGLNDLNGDGSLDLADIEIWVEDVIDSLMGYANLDGTVDGQDFIAWNANKFSSDPDYEYAEGDFNNDGHVNGQDFVIWNNNKYTSAGPLNSETFDYIFGYTGRMFDDKTGLQNNLNRWYDATNGRWISEDPIGFEAGDANIYRYVANSPASFTDPNGLVLKGQRIGRRHPSLNSTPNKEDLLTDGSFERFNEDEGYVETPIDPSYNCHSLTFHNRGKDTDGQDPDVDPEDEIDNNDPSPIDDLDDKYRPLGPDETPEVGDVVLYVNDTNNNGVIDDYTETTHTATVVTVDDGKVTSVHSKPGSFQEVNHHPNDPRFRNGWGNSHSVHREREGRGRRN